MMKKHNLLLILGIAFFLFSCEDSNDSSKKDSESKKSEPENFCECLEMGYEKMQKISQMKDKELSENLNVYNDLKKEMESNKKCNEFAKETEKKYKSREEFIKSCHIAGEIEDLKIKIKGRIENLRSNNNQTAQGDFQNACDCMKWMNDELDEFLSMSVDELTNNPNAGIDFEVKINDNKKCKELLDDVENQYASPEEFMEVCPEMKEVMEKAERMQNM